MWARTRPKTAVKGIRPGSMPAVAAARAVAVAVMLWMSRSAQASWRARSGDWPRRARPRAADGFLQVKERDFDLPSFGVQDGDLAGGVLLVVQEGGQDPDLGGFPAPAAGLGQDGEGDQPGGGVREPFRVRVARSRGAAGCACRRIRAA